MFTFSKTDCDGLLTEAVALLNEHLKHRNLTFSKAGGQIDDGSFTMRVKVSPSDPQAVEEAERKAFIRCAYYVGLTPEDYGRRFHQNGVEFRLVRIHPDRPRYPLVAARVSDNRLFKFACLPSV